MIFAPKSQRSRPPMHGVRWPTAVARLSNPNSLMWTAPEVASRIWSVRVRLFVPPVSAVSPVRKLLADGPPGDLQHDRAAPARRRAFPPSGCLPGWRADRPATPETGLTCPPTSALRQPAVPVNCADRRPGGIGQPSAASPTQPLEWPCAAPCGPRIARLESRRARRRFRRRGSTSFRPADLFASHRRPRDARHLVRQGDRPQPDRTVLQNPSDPDPGCAIPVRREPKRTPGRKRDWNERKTWIAGRYADFSSKS